jgi:hypothetical protein
MEPEEYTRLEAEEDPAEAPSENTLGSRSCLSFFISASQIPDPAFFPLYLP